MSPRRPTPAWGEAAEDWLTAKRVGRRSDDPGHADRARRGDLRRWAAAIDAVMGRTPVDSPHLDESWHNVMTEIGDPDVLLRALDLLAADLAQSSRRRMLSTLRGFCRYLTDRGLLDNDPTVAAELRIAATSDDEIRAFTDDEIARLIAAAQIPSSRARSAWPTRDVAIVHVMAHCGLRVAEVCALTDDTVDRSTDRPMLRLTRGVKGGRSRLVPLPSPTVDHLDAYMTERVSPTKSAPALFVRHDGRPMNQQFVDALLRRLVDTAGTRHPPGAMAHALRHSYGTRLAQRGVPLSIIQQLMGHVDPRTTSRYTRARGHALIDALDDAALL